MKTALKTTIVICACLVLLFAATLAAIAVDTSSSSKPSSSITSLQQSSNSSSISSGNGSSDDGVSNTSSVTGNESSETRSTISSAAAESTAKPIMSSVPEIKLESDTYDPDTTPDVDWGEKITIDEEVIVSEEYEQTQAQVSNKKNLFSIKNYIAKIMWVPILLAILSGGALAIVNYKYNTEYRDFDPKYHSKQEKKRKKKSIRDKNRSKSK